jgi:nitrogen fixation protein NifX
MTLERRLKILRFEGDSTGPETPLRVAFASSDRRHVDQHFGAAESFVVHGVGPAHSSVIEVIQFGPLRMDGNEDKLAAKIAALEGCLAVYCQAVGASAVNQLRAAGIQPVKVSPGAAIPELIEGLQEDLRVGPSAWLARALEGRRPRHGDRFDLMEAEGWSE